MTLQTIKEDVVKEHYGDTVSDWNEAFDDYPHTVELTLWPKVVERYARECVKASLEKAAENAKIFDYSFMGNNPKVDKPSITSENNIVLL